jgi:hypothetical protein
MFKATQNSTKKGFSVDALDAIVSHFLVVHLSCYDASFSAKICILLFSNCFANCCYFAIQICMYAAVTAVSADLQTISAVCMYAAVSAGLHFRPVPVCSFRLFSAGLQTILNNTCYCFLILLFCFETVAK